MLPIEILRHISMQGAGAYYVLVQTCKSIQQHPTDYMMKYYTTLRIQKKGISHWVLPNGNLHVNLNNDPTNEYNDYYNYWYHNNVIQYYILTLPGAVLESASWASGAGLATGPW